MGLEQYMTPMNPEAVPAQPDWLKLALQGKTLAPDQAQLAAQAPMSQGAPAPVPMARNFAPGPGLQSYISPLLANKALDRSVMEQYKAQSQKLMGDQGAGIAQLEQQRSDLANQKLPVDWTAAAGLVDAMNAVNGTKTNLTQVAQDTRGMNQAQKDDKLLKLQEYIQGAKGNMSKEGLQALQQQLGMAHQNDMMLHYAASEKAQDNRAQAMMDRNDIARDNQTSAAVDKITKDQDLGRMSQRLQGADRILNQLDAAKAGKIVDTSQLLNDINSEYLMLLKGTGNSALGHLERTEYTSWNAKYAALMQNISEHPQSINSPDILKQLRDSIGELKGSYNRVYDQRADTLKRNYLHNADATSQQKGTADRLKSIYGTQSSAPVSDPHADLDGLSLEQLREMAK
jgi:hypothetical protein